ncbi:FAD-dependent oxidoreductase [Nocardia brasiliensis]|uniref:FAD-dependent oxidoreductase n=1 Tax=Nocardia brasiliensis TaxID=37326 RepID=UPI003D920C32
MNDPRQYVVIGGGLAGLAAAVWLAEAGKQVTLLERRGRLGGRTHAMKVEAADDLPDNGQHVIASGYEHLFRYLTSVGTRQYVAFPHQATLRWPDGRSVTMHTRGSARCARCPAPTPTPPRWSAPALPSPPRDSAGSACTSPRTCPA